MFSFLHQAASAKFPREITYVRMPSAGGFAVSGGSSMGRASAASPDGDTERDTAMYTPKSLMRSLPTFVNPPPPEPRTIAQAESDFQSVDSFEGGEAMRHWTIGVEGVRRMRRFVGGMLTLFILISAVGAEAQVVTIPLIGPNQSDWVHVGDSTPTAWPPSVGPAWTDTFALAAQPTDNGVLTFYHIEADPNNNPVMMNGSQIGMLTDSNGTINRDPFDPSDWVQQTISVPLNTLQLGLNTISVEAGANFPGTFPLDDFMLKDMSLTVNTVPEPASAMLLLVGSAVLIRRRCHCPR